MLSGGVNSPVRAFKSVGGTPRFIASAEGAYLTDADGNRLLDYIGSWGPMILGHDHPAVRGAIAGALKADRLLLLTDVAGVKGADGVVLTQLSPDEVRDLTEKGVIAGGMIPKTETALKAVEDGVRAAVILDGRVPNACLLELFTDQGLGTMIRSTEPRVKPRIRR